MRNGTVLLAAAFVGFTGTLEASEAAKRLDESARVFEEVMQVPDRAIPQELLEKAHCVIVVPGLKKGGFIVGGKYGRGFATCRRENGIGWSAPAGVRVEGGTVGFQIGGAETDVVMLVLNKRGMEKLLSSKFTLGGDATAAAGPVGRSVNAATDAYLRAEILTWSRSRGVFAGIALEGATLRPDVEANTEVYGSAVQNLEILEGKVNATEASKPLESQLNKYSSRK